MRLFKRTTIPFPGPISDPGPSRSPPAPSPRSPDPPHRPEPHGPESRKTERLPPGWGYQTIVLPDDFRKEMLDRVAWFIRLNLHMLARRPASSRFKSWQAWDHQALWGHQKPSAATTTEEVSQLTAAIAFGAVLVVRQQQRLVIRMPNGREYNWWREGYWSDGDGDEYLFTLIIPLHQQRPRLHIIKQR
ncbi:MAG: hypothetical protein HQL53_09135 [Magnetococcales bacterium]|nr:hypothetical protein [Magnetococcales bacterium]